ncbi:MAG: DUF3516 domain-containing protein [Acidimicrobiales bacterium]
MQVLPPLVKHLPTSGDPTALLEAFLTYAEQIGLELYPAQEEAILELLEGNNVILNTPTGSGKSLVASAAHFAGLARGQRSWYTAPIKALVSEKFFALTRELGAERVGMITGDASVNPQAPVVCCTAEILANVALRDGQYAPADLVIMDEFHYYSDRDRGWAWQVPLLELSNAQFLLMSATLGSTEEHSRRLTELTGRPTTVVASAQRPVPLEYTYRTTPIHETIADLIELRQAPVYIVHFTQKSATDAAQALTSIDVLSKDEKEAVKDAVGGFRFDSTFGADLKRYVLSGIGVHHAGLLPKYRLLVEKLAQEGLLKVICGTDTLGVGVNVPIRTVLFTQLCKFDGQRTRTLTVRDFQQIAGRAGRKGFDDIGYVWCQAPNHVIENLKLEEKAGDDPKKLRKIVRKKPPERGYVHWDEDTFAKLAGGTPEALTSRFSVSHSMLLHLLDRPGDGCAATRRILTVNHDVRPRQRSNIRRAIGMYRSLVEADIVEVLDKPDIDGRMVRVNLDLQDDFALNQPLSLFAVEVLDTFSTDDPEFVLDAVTVIESVLENPGPVLARQLDLAKGEAIAQMKADGVEYEERMERLDEITWPQPNGEALWQMFNTWVVHHPWVGGDTIRPKSVVRDMYERTMTFREYVNHYGLKGVEGVLLRYLSDAYKALVQTVPAELRTDELDDVIEWLGALVRHTDSSLIDEWERLANPEPEDPADIRPPEPVNITTNRRAFTVMVRNELFRWVQMLADERYQTLAELLSSTATAEARWSADDIADAMQPYWDDFDHIQVGAAARGANWFVIDDRGDTWRVTQILVDPDENGEWRIEATVDLVASRELDRPHVTLDSIVRL